MRTIHANQIKGQITGELVIDNEIRCVEWEEKNVEFSDQSILSENIDCMSKTDSGFEEKYNSNKSFVGTKNVTLDTKYCVFTKFVFNIKAPKITAYSNIKLEFKQKKWIISKDYEFKSLVDIEYDGEKNDGENFIFKKYESESAVDLNVNTGNYHREMIGGLIKTVSGLRFVVWLKAYFRDESAEFFEALYSAELKIYMEIGEAKSENKNNSDSAVSNFSLSTNEFMQADTTQDLIPIGKVIADNILKQYRNGRQTIQLVTVLTKAVERYKVGELVEVYGFDNQPVAKARNGTAKEFRITSAEIQYDGSFTQKLNMVEEP